MVVILNFQQIDLGKQCLLLKEQSDHGLHYLLFHLHHWLIINSAQTKNFPSHRFSAKSAHRLSADSVITHLFNPFLWAYLCKHKAISACVHHNILKLKLLYLVIQSSFKVILIEMDGIVRAATRRGGYL